MICPEPPNTLNRIVPSIHLMSS